VSLDVNPGSRQVAENVARMGGVFDLMHAGGRLHQAGCLGCIGVGQVPATGTNSLRTMPRNFKGRSGLKDDHIYLCSPETAAASALTGHITDPRTLGQCPDVPYPEVFSFNDDWFIQPAEQSENVELIRGPNIKPLPRFGALEKDIEGEILLKLPDNVSTDLIMPAGNRVLPLRSNIPAMSDYAFDIADEDFPRRAREKEGGIIVGGDNYGQGSSREHAALVPRYLGVQAKIAKSFARIHKANLINYGIVPLTFKSAGDYDAVNQGQKLRLTGIRGAVLEGKTEVIATVDGRKITLGLELSDREREVLAGGGALNWARSD
jgi:aconitate hydratase